MKWFESQFLRFILIGLINTLFGYSLYVCFLILKLSPSTSIIYATLIGIVFNFKTIGQYVFNNKSKTLFLKFVFVYLLTLCSNICIVKLILEIYDNDYLSGLISIILNSLLSFALNKKFVFNPN